VRKSLARRGGEGIENNNEEEGGKKREELTKQRIEQNVPS